MHRRITVALHFPPPDPSLRERIWECHLPPKLETAGVDLHELALDFELTGGAVALHPPPGDPARARTRSLQQLVCCSPSSCFRGGGKQLNRTEQQTKTNKSPIGARDSHCRTQGECLHPV